MANDNEESGYIKGSKFNPYTHDEFQAVWGTDNWHGGWFEHNGLKYGSSDSEHIYSNYPILGSKSNPFSWDLYQEMILVIDVWCGGWVVSANPNNGLSYYSIGASVGIPEYDNDMNVLGSEAYPVSQDIYQDMCKNGSWEGGYIFYYDTHGHLEKYYASRGELYNPNAGCGSGSGSESGSGSGGESGDGSEGGNGSGGDIISSGSVTVGSNDDFDIVFHWEPSTSVTFKAGYRFEEHFAVNKQFDKIENCTLSLSYNGNKLFTLDGDITYSYNEIDPITHMLEAGGTKRLGLQIPYVTIT